MCAEQAKLLPKHAIRFNSGIWVGRCTISNAHLVVDGNKLFRTRSVRRFPEGPERWDHETLQRFAVRVDKPTSIPDVPTRRREELADERAAERDERFPLLDERCEERGSSSNQPMNAEPSRTESDRQTKRQRGPDDDGTRRQERQERQYEYDQEGDTEMMPDVELLPEDEVLLTRKTDTHDFHYIGHDLRILQASYIEPILISPILRGPRLDKTEQEDSAKNLWRKE